MLCMCVSHIEHIETLLCIAKHLKGNVCMVCMEFQTQHDPPLVIVFVLGR